MDKNYFGNSTKSYFGNSTKSYFGNSTKSYFGNSTKSYFGILFKAIKACKSFQCAIFQPRKMFHGKVGDKRKAGAKENAQGASDAEPSRKRTKEDKMFIVRKLLKLGMKRVQQQEFAIADQLYSKCIVVVGGMETNADKEALLIEVGIRIAEMHFDSGQLGEALKKLDLVKNSMDNRLFSRKETHVKRLMWELDMVSKLYGLLGDAIKGEIALKEFRDVAGDKADAGSMFLSYKHVGDAFYRIGHYKKALKLLAAAKKFADATGNEKSIENASTNLANCYFAMKRYADAIAVFKATPFQRYAASNIGDCYYNMGNFNKAILWFRKAKEAFDRKIGTPDLATLTESTVKNIQDSRQMCFRIANMHGDAGNYGEAVRMLEAMHKAPYNLVYLPDAEISRWIKFYRERMNADRLKISNLVS